MRGNHRKTRIKRKKFPKGYTAETLHPSNMLLLYKGEQMSKEEKLQAFQEYRGAREFSSQ